jgi:tetratricopeptide (TPR) repeat protein
MRQFARILLIILILYSSSFLILADPEDRLFDEGNLLYQQGDFSGALEKYKQIEDQGRISPELFYNMGNCYYKLNQIGRAVLYFERANRLAPGDDDIEANLETANLAIVDKIEAPENFQIGLFIERVLFFIPSQLSVKVLLLLYYLAAIVGLVLIVQGNIRFRAIMIRALFACFFLLFFFLSILVLQWYYLSNRIEAVLLVDETAARSGPDSNSTEVFSIHEGIKVRIEQQTDEWSEIILPDGKVGWVKSDTLETI